MYQQDGCLHKQLKGFASYHSRQLANGGQHIGDDAAAATPAAGLARRGPTSGALPQLGHQSLGASTRQPLSNEVRPAE